MATSNKPKMPSVSKSDKAMVFTNFAFYNLEDGVGSPVAVEFRSRAALQNIKQKKDGSDNTANVSNGDEAYLVSTTDVLRVAGSFTVIPTVKQKTYHFSSGDKDVIESLESLFATIGDDQNINKEVFALYAKQILNGSWLWRNLALSATVDIVVDVEDPRTGNIVEENVSTAETLSEYMSDSFSGVSLYRFNVRADIKMAAGNGAQVFPSQEFVDGPKQLLKINGNQAAFRDTKVWNAIRTIDTWYPEYSTYNRPIAVETLGANKDLGIKLRVKNGFIDIMLKAVSDGISALSHEDKLFCAAVIHRGGVYSE